MADSLKPIHGQDGARQLDECCEAFEAEWKNGQRPQLAAHLAAAPATDQLIWLRELIPIDLFQRRQRGEQPRVDDYLQQFPQLEAGWLAVIFAEQNKFPVVTVGARYADTIDPEATDLVPQIATPSNNGAIFVPGYELIGELGRGAMGVVYQARQIGLGRIVALKMIRSRGDASPDELARFKSEGAAIASLAHPNIVQIYDLGEHEGRPYFSLEYIDGGTLARKIAGVPQPPREAARTIETLARAIHQAHQAGIVHRDLKPANVLMTRYGVPKITDFGLAKQLQADHSATASGMLLGTPQYMAPEQAAGNSADVGAAADIYALGVILYEMLTGRPPFQAGSLTELLQAITTQEPAPPSLLKRDTPRDLETICLKCLRKYPSTRYDSAAALADDLLLFLEDQPIRARRTKRLERLKLWCKRNPQVAIPSAALLSLLVLVSIASIVAAVSFRNISERANKSAREASHATKLADLRAQDTQLELARSRINEARMLRRSQRVGQQTEALAKIVEARDIFRELEKKTYPIDANDWFELRNEAASALLVPDIVTQSRWPRESAQLQPVASDLAHDRYIPFPENAKQVEVRRIGTGEVLDTIAAPPGNSFTQGAFSEIGEHLVLHSKPDNQLHFWEVKGKPRFLHQLPTPSHWRVMSRDGHVYCSGQDGAGLQVIRVNDGKVLTDSPLGMPLFGNPLHPTQPWVALAAQDKLILFDYEQQQVRWERQIANGLTNGVWSHDGRWLAVTGPQSLQAISAQTGEPLFAMVDKFDHGGVYPIPISQAGMLGSQDWSGSLYLHHPLTGRLQLKTTAALFDWPQAQGASGRLTLGYSGNDYLVREARAGRMYEFALHGTDYLALSRSAELLAVHRVNGPTGIYHLPSGELLATLPKDGGDVPLAFEPDDRALLVYGHGQLQRLPLAWDDEERTRLQIGPATNVLPSPMRDFWGMDQRGKYVVVPDYGRGGDIYRLSADGTPPELLHTEPQHDVRHAQISPDGRWAVLGSHVHGKVAVYSTENAKLVKDLIQGGGHSSFSPDGKYIAVGRFSGGSEIFSVPSWKQRGSLPGQRTAFTHDGKLLAVDSDIGTISLYESSSLRCLAKLEVQDQVRLHPRAFTPNGAGLIACALEERRVIYFDLAGLRRELQKLELDFELPIVITESADPRPIPEVTVRSE